MKFNYRHLFNENFLFQGIVTCEMCEIVIEEDGSGNPVYADTHRI